MTERNPAANPPADAPQRLAIVADVRLAFVGTGAPAEFDLAMSRVPCVGEKVWVENDWWSVWRVEWGWPDVPVRLVCERSR